DRARVLLVQRARLAYSSSAKPGLSEEPTLPPSRAQVMARAMENPLYSAPANTAGNEKDNTGSHGQSRIIQDDGNVLKEATFYGDEILIESLDIKINPERLSRPLEGPMADWWRRGVDWMLANRNRKLD